MFLGGMLQSRLHMEPITYEKDIKHLLHLLNVLTIWLYFVNRLLQF